MEFKSIDDQNKEIIRILKQYDDLMIILDYIAELKLPNFYLAAGCIFQPIWNYYDKKSLNYGIKDIDIIYFDGDNLSKEDEQLLENNIRDYLNGLNLDYKFDVHNQARMHLWKKENCGISVDQYVNSEDAISHWIATVHAIGLTKENGCLKLYAPYGLSDIFSRTIRPLKHQYNNKELYDQKVKAWSKRYNNLKIIEWQ